ncbi:hypothetical protein DM01DRAFT_1399096 [Hesseltinella vesiculosa]|uniref:PH domain-containing protein n=1 Tax=Hesseltinella vesiculosa TaxID=101127 RepID=A0A1X2GR59_9FUNG|nr:hypothetical protein DM01DRAFT_1399096 [Hesseltinella vesiculosa]
MEMQTEAKTKRRIQPPRRFWSLQRITGHQQWKKVGPMQFDKIKAKQHVLIADTPPSHFSSVHSITSHDQDLMDNQQDVIHLPPSLGLPTTDEAAEQDDQTDQDSHVTEDELVLQPQHLLQQRLGLRRKAAHGLKKIITHFSLSEISALADTPGLSSNHAARSGKAFLASSRPTQIRYPLQPNQDLPQPGDSSADSSSLATLSSTSDLHITPAPALMTTTPAADWSPSPIHASTSDRSLPPLPCTSRCNSHPEPGFQVYRDNAETSSTDHHDNPKLRQLMQQATTHVNLRQAANWLGKPFQRFLTSPLLTTMQANMISPHEAIKDQVSRLSPAGLLLPRLSQDQLSLDQSLASNPASDQLPWAEQRIRANLPPFDYNFRFVRKKVLRCRDYQYELFVQLNDVTRICQTGVMKKIAKGISAASPKESFSFEVDSPFSLTFTMCAKPIPAGLTKMKSLLSKMDLGSLHGQDQHDLSRELEDQESLEKVDLCEATMPVVGYTSLLSGNRFEAFTGKGLSRYTLTKPIQSTTTPTQPAGMDLELMVAFHLEDAISPCNTYLSGLGTDELDFDAALAACRLGDYLTFYVRTKSVPTWVRYWVTLDHGELYIRQMSYEHKDPIDSIPLSQLESVSRPWEDLQEEVYFGRKDGIVLQFKKDHIDKTHVALDDQETLEGNMYLFADSSKKAALWRTVLSAYATADYMTPDPSINAKFLW